MLADHYTMPCSARLLRQPLKSQKRRLYHFRLCLAALCGLAATFSPFPRAQAETTAASIVINELHHNPDINAERVEFIELFNAGAATADLSAWGLADGIDYLFPAGTTLPPGGFLVVAEDPEALRAKFGVTALGPFSGRLAGEGESLTLRDALGRTQDELAYGLGFPWPTVGDEPGLSAQLLNPAFDNAVGGNWRSGSPTPGRGNSPFAERPLPLVEAVAHTPKNPRANTPVTVTARVSAAMGVSAVRLLVQVVDPGGYIALHDPEYAGRWTAYPMEATDGVYQVELPPQLQTHRRLIRYRVEAVDSAGGQVLVPYPDDPQPNFAYFVYDGAPPWTGSVTGAADGRTSYDFAQMRGLPIYHFIAKQPDIADALFMPPSGLPAGYTGNDYLWRGTLVYGGEVYDHVRFRARGGFARYATGKNMWKVKLNRGHYFQAYDDWGRPYATTWDTLNLSAVIQQVNRQQRGEQGMFESLSFRLFNLAGVPAPKTHFVHLRVIDEAAETGANQYVGDFWGLYLAVEQMDGRFIDEHRLPDGNLYKIENGAGELNHLGAAGPTDGSDIAWFIRAYRGPKTSDWWRANLDLPGYYSYRSIVEAVHHYDIDQEKNYFYFHNPDTNRWSVLPWDVDLTWHADMPGTGVEPFLQPVLSRPEFNLEYQNRLRELRDLLFNSEQLNEMIDEYAALIDTPAGGLSMVDADRAMWDYNPIFGTRYVDRNRTFPGLFYNAVASRDFRGMVDAMKAYVAERSAWIDRTLLTDAEHPLTPNVSYIGAAGYPADGLQFRTDGFRDPQGGHTFAALEWRVGEVSRPGLPAYDPAQPKRYEIDARWRSGAISPFNDTIALPPGACPQGRTCRVRVRMQDNTGRWSHWSPPHEFTAGAPAAAPASVKLTEIMYNPLAENGLGDEPLEFVELLNTGDRAALLGGAFFASGIEYTFPAGTTLEPGGYWVLARDRAAFSRRYGFAPAGEYHKKLNNSGDTLTLADAYGRTLTTVTYQDGSPWPGQTDGEGYSLALRAPQANPAASEGWRRSTLVHGSPGAADPLPVVVNEVLAHPAAGDAAQIELHNPTDLPADIGGWRLSGESLAQETARIKPGTLLPPGGYLVLDATALGDGLALDKRGGEVHLASAAADGRTTGYRHSIAYGAAGPGQSLGRHVNSSGGESFPIQTAPTLGRANAGPLVGPVVISQVMYQPRRGHEYVELLNLTGQTVPLYDPGNLLHPWRIEGIGFDLPTGLELPPHGRLRVIPTDPIAACRAWDGEEQGQVAGPYPTPLSDSGQAVTLLRPAALDGPDGPRSYVVVDEIEYQNSAPWPEQAAGQGAALGRREPPGYGNEPASWEAHLPAAAVVAASGAPYANICNFDVYQAPDSSQVRIRWVVHAEENVEHYQVWRSAEGQRDRAELVALQELDAADQPDTPAEYTAIALALGEEDRAVYWLVAIGSANQTFDVSTTRARGDYSFNYFPIIGRQVP